MLYDEITAFICFGIYINVTEDLSDAALCNCGLGTVSIASGDSLVTLKPSYGDVSKFKQRWQFKARLRD